RSPGAAVGGVVLAVDPESADAPFRQLRQQIVEAVERGRLTPGTRLPAVRALAEQVGVAANTTAKVYRELEAAGVLETRGRTGTSVAESDMRAAVRLRAAEELVEHGTASGSTADDATATVRDALDRTTQPARPARSARNAPACRTPPPPRLDSAHLGSTAFLHISAEWACARTRWDLTICSGVSRSAVDPGPIAAACPPPLLLEHPPLFLEHPVSEVHEGPRGVQHALRHPPH